LSPEIGELEADADRLCQVVEQHFDGLIADTSETERRFDDVTFRAFRRDRNVIYRASRRFRWFLKLLRVDNLQAVARERLGAATIEATIGSRPEYGGSPVIRVSTNPAFVLSAAVEGRALDRALVRQALMPLSFTATGLQEAFRTTGTLLATLHASATLPDGAPPAEKHEFASLAQGLRRVKQGDAVTKAIAVWYERHGQSDSGRFFVHGNMRPDNLVRVGNRIAFLDFEHCGSGPFYQDLGRPIAYLLQLTAVSPFARRRIREWVRAYLGAYGAVHAYDERLLNAFVNARLARHYLQTRSKSILQRRIAGIPVSRGTLARLLTASLEDGIEGVAPGALA